ncbi:transposase [Bacteroides fragilis]|nr:transposase [Bacteroides fragilis]MCS2198746.1 transposase [Bacteroides fragilis]MCS2209573.1 transposase [Bacteroides fragilis]MCS2213885.1 transposase [Bacteroides fragilis]MCS2265795.1 transposase [Bacteroides fragilis]MCS2497797.1 transposase [Bacteroides fragilis]
MFYLVKTGCQWHMLPLDLPKWQLVYYYYRKWATLLDFDLLLEKFPKDLFFPTQIKKKTNGFPLLS